MSRHLSSRRALSIGEWLAIIGCLLFLAAILFPVFAKSRENHHRHSCPSHLKQIELAFLGYIQDYDEKFPPASSVWRSPASGLPYPQDWGATQTFPSVNGRAAEAVPPLLDSYIRNRGIFVCPTVAESLRDRSVEGLSRHFTYRYNDLAAAVSQEEFTGVARTVLAMDGEDQIFNVGHAWEPNLPPQTAAFLPDGTCPPGGGATVRDAVKRHSDGANYLFADGHVKWYKAAEGKVFFPSRESAVKDHLVKPIVSAEAAGSTAPAKVAIGPDPAGDMMFAGHQYSGTFHVR